MSGTVRIIAGRWRRRRLPIADVPGLRPTPDRVRETLFSWLHPHLPGARCLDLFAGTGALGIEAASRGASRVVLVESNGVAVKMLRAQAHALAAAEIEVVHADAGQWLARGAEPFDIVFLDPPFGACDLAELCRRLEHGGWLAPGALVYLESAAERAAPQLPEHWDVRRAQRAGQVRYYLAAPGKPAHDQAPGGGT